MPTPAPGLKRVPRWRTMISPPVTACPANVFTPRRWAFESRPLRLEPKPFLCAICLSLLVGFRGWRADRLRRLRGPLGRLGSPLGGPGARRFGGRPRRFPAPRGDLGDLDLRELLAVAGAPLVPALGLELEHAQLLSPHVRQHLRGDLHALQARGVEHGILGAVEDRLERDVLALLHGQALDEQALAALDAVLLAAGLHDRVHVCRVSILSGKRGRGGAYSGVAGAFAAERRRPPLRPRRRGLDCRPSAWPSSCSASPAASVPGSRASGDSACSPAAAVARASCASACAAFLRRGRTRGVARSATFVSVARGGVQTTSPDSSSSRALAAVRPTLSMRTMRFSPTCGAAPAIEMM